jgi:HEAT repeat protein
VVKFIDNREWAVRLEVCNILRAIGTERSKGALEEAVKDATGLVANAAREALKAIETRSQAAKAAEE